MMRQTVLEPLFSLLLVRDASNKVTQRMDASSIVMIIIIAVRPSPILYV